MNISASGKRKRRPAIKRGSLVYYSRQKSKSSKHFNWRIFWFFLKIFLPLATILYIFYFSPLFKIKDIIISGNDKISVDQILSNIPESGNIFSFDSQTVERAIKSKIPQIEEIKIYKGIPNALKVIVKERQPVLLWQSGISYYLLSEDGVAFKDVTTDVQDYGAMPKVNDLRSMPVTIDKQIVSSHFVIFTNKIFSTIKDEANLDPDYFTVDETTVDLCLYLKNGFYIKFDTLRDADTQINNLKLILTQKRQDIHEYVDLRINGWVYTK